MKSTLLLFSVVLASAFAAGCGDGNQVSNGGSSGSGGSTGGGTSSGGTATGGASTGGSTGGGGATSTGGTSTGGGGPCGGFTGTTCDPTQYCDYPDDLCGAADGSGVCTPTPDTCPDVIDPVCACDGKVYNNACEAAAAGVDLQMLGGCPSPPGVFPCGSGYCEKANELCQIEPPKVPGDPTKYTCIPLPPNCQVPNATCACLADMACGQMCMLADGGFTLTCSGG